MKWVNSLQRSFNSIKAKLIEGIRTNIPEITDLTDNNIFILMISQISSVAEVIHYYADNLLRESFFTSARRFSSVVKHTDLIDYNIKSASGASVDVVVRFKNQGEYVTIPTSNYKIPKGTIFYSSVQASNEDTIQFISTKDVQANINDSYVIVPALEYQEVLNRSFGPITDPLNVLIQINDENGQYMEGSMAIQVNPDTEPTNEPWVLVDSLFDSWEDDKHYIIRPSIASSMYPAISFGDGIKGKVPLRGSFIIASYRITKAEAGNVPENSIYASNIEIPSWADEVEADNPRPASGGNSYEDMDDIRFHAPLYVRSMETCITQRDYEDAAMLVPGVNKAYVDYKCGKFVNVYITPDNDGGGNYAMASNQLLNSVLNALSRRKVITTAIQAFPVGVSFINLHISVTGKVGVPTEDIFAYSRDALLREYSYENSNINRNIRLSDIYSVVDNLPQVEYLDIIELSVTPYVRPGSATTNLLYLDIINKSGNVVQFYILLITVNGVKRFQLLKFNLLQGDFGRGDVFSDLDVTITFNSDPDDYNLNDNWSFHTFASGNNSNVVIDDFTIPILLIDNLTIDTRETL